MRCINPGQLVVYIYKWTGVVALGAHTPIFNHLLADLLAGGGVGVVDHGTGCGSDRLMG
ncbi:MAG: hypothetical protein ACOC10_11920 [Bacteroidota bacterium]